MHWIRSLALCIASTILASATRCQTVTVLAHDFEGPTWAPWESIYTPGGPPPPPAYWHLDSPGQCGSPFLTRHAKYRPQSCELYTTLDGAELVSPGFSCKPPPGATATALTISFDYKWHAGVWFQYTIGDSALGVIHQSPFLMETGTGPVTYTASLPLALCESDDVRLSFEAVQYPIGFGLGVSVDNVVVELSYAFTWASLGNALAGASGLPQLVGTGPLSAGSSNSVDLSNAAPSAVAGLFLALASTPVPFKGGTLVPVPFFDPVIANTSASGTISIPFVMPSGIPAGTGIWVQWAIQDAAAAQGIALSNAIKGTTP